MLYPLLLMGVFLVFASSCQKDDVDIITGSFTDPRDGKVYQTVAIGNQVWMAENLAYLPNVVGAGTGSQTTPHYYVYDYNGSDVNAAKATSNYATYGVLYNWTAAVNACPGGWHLPSQLEWIELTDYLDGEEVAGGKLKETGTAHWFSPNTGATDAVGFTALPGGYRNLDGSFIEFGTNGAWWSATETDTNYAWGRYMGSDYSYVGGDDGDKEIGGCVRCLRD
ncbi:MAG: FISUMP domain-containing protein [Bacteroidota bacterium]